MILQQFLEQSTEFDEEAAFEWADRQLKYQTVGQSMRITLLNAARAQRERDHKRMLIMAEIIRVQEQQMQIIHHALANAQEWDISDPEDNEMDRDQQVSNWLERAFEGLRDSQSKIADILHAEGAND